ncbi:unnamed protein product [Mytilus edulis]|uniref:Uncharacterized protein n=1 Tax=Mytilus edulis TaxID=6550 RepID=A0A8S3VB03_MYTED|nr:unnamed protein product [Mytilus edulis]
MYHSNITSSAKYQTTVGQKIGKMNIVSNPLAILPEPRLMKSYPVAVPDLIATTAQTTSKHIKKTDTRINLSVNQGTVGNVGVPFVVPSFERSKVNLPVVDFRYFTNKPVYQGTTLPLPTVTRQYKELTVFNGFIFSLIIIIGTILGAFAGYGMYKMFQ